MDLDGDGVLSMYELEFFYEEQCQKLEAMAIEPLPFEDCLCQMLDLVKPEFEGRTLASRDARGGFSLSCRCTLGATGCCMVEETGRVASEWPQSGRGQLLSSTAPTTAPQLNLH